MIFLLTTLGLVFVPNIWQHNPLIIQSRHKHLETQHVANLRSVCGLFGFCLDLHCVPCWYWAPPVIQAPAILGLLMVEELTLPVNYWTIRHQNYDHSNQGQISENFKHWVVLLHVTWRPRCLTPSPANQTSARAIAALHIRVSWPVPVSLATVPSYVFVPFHTWYFVIFYDLAPWTASKILWEVYCAI